MTTMTPTWLRPLATQRFGTKALRHKAGRKAASTRLLIETLEDRVVPAFAISAPASAIAGVAFPVTIAAQDQHGNLETNYNGSVTVTSSDKQQIYLSASAINLYHGTATVMMTLDTPDTLTLRAASADSTGTSAPIAVSPSVASFGVSVPATATAGTSFTATITAQDRFGDAVTGYNGPVTISSSDGQPVSYSPSSISWNNGSAQVSVTLDTAGTVTLSAGLGSVQGTSAQIAVSPAKAASFTVGAPSTAGAGEGFIVAITAKDPYGNVVAGYSGPVTLTSSDGQSVTVSPSTPAWSDGTASVTVTLGHPNQKPITLKAAAGGVTGSTNLVVEAPAFEAISNGLASLVSWASGQSFPVVGTATAIQDALQNGLLTPINNYFATNQPTLAGLANYLSTLNVQVGGLKASVDPKSFLQTTIGKKVIFSLDFVATETKDTSVKSFGAQADQLGIHLDASTEVNATTSLNFRFSFGVDTTSGLTPAQAFFLNVPAGGLSASVAINATGISSGITIGFLGAQTTAGSIQMNAQIANVNGLSNLTIAGLQMLNVSPSGSLSVVLPLQASLGTQTASGKLTINSSDLSTGAAPAVQFQGFSGWQNFTTVGPDAVLGMLNQLSSQLGQIAGQVWTTELPFLSSLSLAQAASLEQAFQTEVTDQIGYWSDTLQRTVAQFTTAQGLATLLAQGLDVSPSSIGVHFDPTTNSLTYNLSFTSYTFSSLLSQSLQVDLNKGGLANASLSSGQLSLVPKITASLTFGVNLTPLGQGFALSLSTPLSQLNNKAGVRINATLPDMQISLSDGTSFQVSLAGAKAIQDVIKRIQAASGGKVTVSIDPTSGQALDLVEATPPPGAVTGTSPIFAVTALNQSEAAADLGILGTDVLGIGTITGHSLSGDTLQNHFFIENVTIQASITGTASQVNATADLAAVALKMVNGTGTIQGQGSIALKKLVTLQQIAGALTGATPLGSLVTAQVSGLARLDLPLRLALPLAGVTLPPSAEVAVNWTDITNPSTLSVTVTPPLNLSHLTIQPVLQGLEAVGTFVTSAGSNLLNQQLPGLGINLQQVANPGALISAALGQLAHNVPATIDQLAGQLSTLLGQPVTVSCNTANNQLLINLNYTYSTTQSGNLGFDLSKTLRIADVNGSAPLSLTVNGSVKLGLVIDFSNPSSPQFYLQDSSKISVGALVDSTGIRFDASIGPLGISVSNGKVLLDNGKEGQAATWTVGLNPSSNNHLWPLAGAAGQITNAIKGRIDIDLPVFFPTPDQPLDPNTPDIQLIVSDLSHPVSTTSLVVPNVASALSGISLNGIMDQVVDGWDGVMRMLQTALTQQIDAAKIPVVGQQLQQALGFLQRMDQQVTTLLQNAPQLAATTVQDALYKALGPQGLNWLAKLDPSGGSSEANYVQLQQSSGNIHYLLKLHQDLKALSTSAAIDLGLSGLGLSINGDASISAGFDATLGFGLSQQYGFYVDSSDTASVGFGAQFLTTPGASITATLGFLQFQVTNPQPQTPQLSGKLSLGLNNPEGTGRLSLSDLSSTSAYKLGMDANANVDLKLDATLGGNTNLPHVSTEFLFDWSLHPTAANPDKLGFSDVTLDLGGFIDNILGEVGKVLAPIEPLAKVLGTPLPVISQLAGHPFTLVDLASALGYCSPSTADFIDAVTSFVNGIGSLPSSLSKGIDVGSFTLDPNAAEDPSNQGELDPATIAPNAPDKDTPITGFQIPILSDPASAFQLLLGKDVPLITYETPKLDLSFAFDEFFPIIGPLGADLAGKIGAEAQFGFGFDTHGFREFAEGGFRDPALILDGFYVSDRLNPDGTGPVTPQAELYGSIAAYAALDLGIASAGVGGGLFASVDFTVHDPSGTGKVHLEDLEEDVKKGTIFDASGALQAFLDAYVEIDLGFISHRWDFNIASVTLAQIGEPAPSTPPVPQLADPESNGVLRLNVGPYASQRLYVNSTDGNETLMVSQVPGKPNSVIVSGYGYSQEYDNVSEITGEGAAGNDNITIDAGSSIDVNFALGAGTNNINVKSARNVTLTGGAGNDTLEVDNAARATITGGPGHETLIVTGSEPATLQAGSGTDAPYAGSGAGQVLYGGSGTNLLVAGSGDNQVLHGGTGVSTLVGGTGAGQQFFGDSSTGNTFGGTGKNQTLTAGTGNAHLYAGEADGQILDGGSGNDVLQVGWHLPNPGSPASFSNMPVGAIDPTTGQHLQVGWHLNETLSGGTWHITNYTPGDGIPGQYYLPEAGNEGYGHSYLIQAGTGNTLIIGGRGDDTIHGGSGNNTIYGGGGAGNKLIYAGVGATEMYGGGPGDSVSPATGNHTLYGGSGLDVLYGGDGVNISVKYTADGLTNGLTNPGGDNGNYGVNVLAAGTGNTTMYSDSNSQVASTLIGGSGLDKLFAGADSGDYLEAGSGVDSLYGGTGSDVFQLPFIPANQQAATPTPDYLVGGYGLTTLVLKPVETVLSDGQLTQVSLTTDSDILLTGVPGTTDQYLATLNNLDNGAFVGQVPFTLPQSVERIALMGGVGDNHIKVDSSVQRGMLLYGGPGHNILEAGSGNSVLVGGSGTSVLEGGSGDDVLYGSAIPAIYQDVINNLGATANGPVTSGSTSTVPLMNWLRKQPAGHNVLIAGSGNSVVYAGDGGDLLIGGSAHFDAQKGRFVVDQGAGRDVLVGGKGQDLMIGGLPPADENQFGGVGGASDVMIAGSGNSILIGGGGEDILEGGSGSDVLIGGGLLNVMTSNSAAGSTSYLLDGTGINFEFAGAGNDKLFDYSNSSDPLQAAAWSQANSLAAHYDVALPQTSTNEKPNPTQVYQALLDAENTLSADFLSLNILSPVPDGTSSHATQYGTLTSGSSVVTNLYFLKETATTTATTNIVTGLATTELVEGELVTGTGITAGTTITAVKGQSIDLSNVVTSSGKNVTLYFSDPIIQALLYENATIKAGSTKVTGVYEPIALVGVTKAGSTTITNLASTLSLAVGDTVAGAGIPDGTTIAQILDKQSIVLSQAAKLDSNQVLLDISSPLAVGQPVSGPGIPAGTTIASVGPGSTSITLSNPATQSLATDVLCFGSLPFAGPQVSDAAGTLPQGESVTAVLSGTSIALSQAATKSESNVALTFTLTAEENQERLALDNALQGISTAMGNALSQLGATTEIDFLQGGKGSASLYAGPKPVWMYGSSDANASTTFYITPSNYAAFAQNLDTILGGKASNGTLMFLADGQINIDYDKTSFTDKVTINNSSYKGLELDWKEGSGISTIGVQTMGGNDTVAINTPISGAPKSTSADDNKLGAWTSAVRVVDGGFATIPSLQGNVVIDATHYTEIGEFIGGVGNDTIKIDQLSTARNVGGTPVYTQVMGGGGNKANELDIVGNVNVDGGLQVIGGTNKYTGNNDIQLNGTWLNVSNFQRLVVIGDSLSGSSSPSNSSLTNRVSLGAGLIPVVYLEGGSGKGVVNTFDVTGGNNWMVGGSDGATNQFTAEGGTNTFFGGQASGTTNTMTVSVGTNTLFGGSGANTFNLGGAGTYSVIGGGGVNVVNASGGTGTLTGGSGANTFNLSGAGTYYVTGGVGVNVFNASGGTSTITGGSGQNTYKITGAGTYNLIGGRGPNALVIQCATSYDEIRLSQSGTTLTATGTINGVAFTATASNMTSVELDGSQAGDNVLDARGTIVYTGLLYVWTNEVTMPVSMKGFGAGNSLYGGLGNDTLDGGSGRDYLHAGNDSDRLYVSGSDSSYIGTGANPLIFRAGPSDDIAIYANGLNVNGTLTYATYSDGRPYYYLTGTYYHFAGLSGIGSIQIEDGGGHPTYYYAQESEVPRSAYYTFPGNPVALVQVPFDIKGDGSDLTWSATVTTPYPAWVYGPNNDAAQVIPTYWNNYNNYSVQWGPWLTSSQWPFDWANTYGLQVTIHADLGSNFLFFHSDGELKGYVQLNGYVGVENWNYNDSYYGQWQKQIPVVVEPGITVSNLTAVATGPNGANVPYPVGPTSFTTGGASPDPTRLSYTMKNAQGQVIQVPSGSMFPVGTTTVTATATDAAGNTSTSTFNVTVVSLSAWQDATAIGLSTSATGTVYGQPVTFTATMAQLGPGAATPTGKVTFKDGNTALGTGTLVTIDGVTTATFTTINLGVGSHSIKALYAGGSSDLASTSAATTVTVAKDATTTTLAASPSSTVYGQSVTFTATVAATAPGASSPTGTVTFMEGSTRLGTGTLRTSGGVTTATFTTGKLAVGSHSITAAYGGGPDDLPSTSTASTFTVGPDTTTVALTASSTSTVYGQSVTFRATVAVARPGAGVPTGKVTFMDGSSVLGTGTLSPSGTVAVATFSTTSLSVGSHSIAAVYGGDTDDLGITSPATTVKVAPDTTSIALSVSTTSAVYGQKVTFTAKVAVASPGAGTPTGKVTFMDGSALLQTVPLVTSGGVTTATFATTGLSLGSHTITAFYAGDTDDLAITSAATTVNVAIDKTSTTVVATSPSTVYGQPLTFTVTVAVASPGAGTPTGTVMLMDGTTTLGTATLVPSGSVSTATFTTSALSVGSHKITATYAGDNDDLKGVSPATTVTVAKDATADTLASSTSASVYGQPILFEATVSLQGTGFGTPTGTVTFMDGTTKLGTGTLSTSGGLTTATFTTGTLALGAHSITAVYAGDTIHATSTSGAMPVTVAQDATTTIVTASPSSAVYGQSVMFRATIAATAPGVGTPTGTVTFMDGKTVLGTGTLTTTNGVTTATFSTTKLAVGSHAITAVYAGGPNDLTSMSPVLNFTVSPSPDNGIRITPPETQGSGTSLSSGVTPSVVDQAIAAFDIAIASQQPVQVLGLTAPAGGSGSSRKVHDLALATLLPDEDQ
jgi:Ca2+-binding RTX toxin-like protein